MRISEWSSDVCSSALIGNLSRTGFFLQQCQQRRSIEDRFAHSPESSRRPARNASTDASDFPAVYFRASACACAIDWATVRRMTPRSEENTSELQSLMRNSYAVLCLKKKTSPYWNRNNTRLNS